MPRFCRISAVLALALSATSLSAPARAQSASEIAAAKQWFSEGLALEEQGKFAEALERFTRALEVKKTPQIQFHVGLCQLKTGALVEAIVSFGRATELAKAEGNAQVESASAGELAALRPRVPSLELSVKGTTRPTDVSLDGVSLSMAALEAPIPVNPGGHEIIATFETGQLKRPFEVAERERAKIVLEAPAAAVGPEATAPALQPEPEKKSDLDSGRGPSSEQRSRVLPWVFVGGGVVAALGGFYAWKRRAAQKEELDAICPTPTSCPEDRQSDVDSLESKGKLYNGLAIGLWSVGAAALATGGYLLLSGGPSEKKAVRVAPALGPGVAGGFVTGAF